MLRTPDNTKSPVQTLRERACLSIGELAFEAGLDRNTVSELERGLRIPHMRTVRKVAKALGVDPYQLLPHHRTTR